MRDVRPPTILLVDDNEPRRYAVGRILAAAGFWVMEAATGEEALRLAAKRPHLVVLDVNLPDMDGTEVCRRVKSDPATASIPVLHLSATRRAAHDKISGLESGADAYLTQPCDPRELLATINSLLRIRNAEEKARTGVREWQQTFDAITDAICLVDFQGRIVRHNRAMQEMFAGPSVLQGRSVQEVLRGRYGLGVADLPQVKGNFARQSVEIQAGPSWFRVTLDPVLTDSGTFLGAVEILSDITEHKHADEERARLLATEQQARVELESTLAALRVSRDRAQQIFNSNLIGIAVGSNDGRVIEANDYFLNLVGYGREDLQARRLDWRALSAPEYRDADGCGLEELAHYGICTPYEKEYLRRDGSRVPVLIGAAYFEGSCDEYVAFILDLTERKHEQAELRRAQERFRTAQESSLDAYNILRPICDIGGNVVDFEWEYANPAAAKAYGRPMNELLGQRLLALFPGHKPSGLFDSYVRVWNSGVPHDIELFYDADGVTGWFRNMAVKLDDGVAVSFSDISERKRAEAALRLNEKLAATGRLAGSIAHEINNPMATVTNLLYLLDTYSGLDAKARGYVTMARQEVARISHIVKQMLGFYRESPKPVPVKLSEILASVLDLFHHKLDAAHIRVHPEFLSQDEVEAFPGEMRQVFTNLVSNALEAMPQGGTLRVRVAAAYDWHTGREGVRVLVADSGPGIEQKHLVRLFEPFFTTKGEKGTGLGLWLSSGMVRNNHGSIRVRSSVRTGRNGTAFAVFIPKMAKRVLTRAAS